MLKNCFIWLLFLPLFIRAQTYPQKPTNYVTDETGILSGEEQSALNAKLRAFEDSTSNQIFVYITQTLDGRDIESFSQELFHNWKIGQAGKNNGVLIAVFINDHKFRIQTGYGLEGALPDLLTKRIQDEIMRPQFKAGDYYKGIDLGLNELIYYSQHEFVADTAPTQINMFDYLQSWAFGYVFNLILLIAFLINVRKPANRKPIVRNGLIILAIVVAMLPCVGAIILVFMNALTRNFKGFGTTFSSDGGSSWGSSDSSSWSSSDSGSDSGFDGGGGGDSGGGGSSSDW